MPVFSIRRCQPVFQCGQPQLALLLSVWVPVLPSSPTLAIIGSVYICTFLSPLYICQSVSFCVCALGGRRVKPHCDFNLHFSDTEWGWVPLWLFVQDSCFSLWECVFLCFRRRFRRSPPSSFPAPLDLFGYDPITSFMCSKTSPSVVRLFNLCCCF